jgi:hypothetical protein
MGAGAYTADYHSIFRNADGSINVNQLYELKSDSRIYEAGVNGSKIGCSFEKVEILDPEPAPITAKPAPRAAPNLLTPTPAAAACNNTDSNITFKF